MTLETFFEKFELFADAPGAVGKMRELVLGFALSGRISPKQDWQRTRLGKVCQITMGNSPPGDTYNDRGEGVPLINGPVEFSTGPFGKTIRTKFTTAPTKFCEPGELLICVRGSTTGRTNIAGFRACIGRGVAAVNAGEHQRFVNLFLWHRRSFIFDLGTGSTFPSISYKDLAELEINLPTLAEQKRIVAKVDEMMALCDRLEAQQQERESRHTALVSASLARFADAPTPENLQFLFHPSYAVTPADLRKTILSMAVQGKLIRQEAGDESGHHVLKTILEERERIGEPVSLSPIDEREQPFYLPQSWAWTRIGYIASIKHGYAFSSVGFTSDPTSYVLTTPGNFFEKGGFRDRGSKTKYYLGDVDSEFILKPRDLIIPMTEQAPGLLGSPAFIPDDGKTYIHNQRLGKLGFYSASIEPAFVYLFFNSAYFRNELARTCTGMKVRHSSPKKILKVLIPICSLAEQRRIVAKVDQLMALVDQLEAQLAASQATAGKLMEAVVAELTTRHPAKC